MRCIKVPNILHAQDDAFSSLPLHNDLGSGKGRHSTRFSPLRHKVCTQLKMPGFRKEWLCAIHQYGRTVQCRQSCDPTGIARLPALLQLPGIVYHGYRPFKSRTTRRRPTDRVIRTCGTLVSPWLSLYLSMVLMSAYSRVCTLMAAVTESRWRALWCIQ